MRLALRLARRGTGSTYPNPSVGAVVVKEGALVGAAHSAATGGPHAEVRALREAGEAARGATVYITLEPCSHFGRTPPCTDALIAAGVAEVVFGLRDPAPHAHGRARALLEGAGIQVREGLLEASCRRVHAHYLHHEATRLPFVTLKSASSLDGRIACLSGDSRWITGEAARARGHRLRARHHAIAIGVSTLLTDNPSLTVRLARGSDPVPVIFDTHLRGALASPRPDLLRPGTLVVHGPHASAEARAALVESGAAGIEVSTGRGGSVDVLAALQALGARPIRSLLVEGGGRLLASFLAAGAWQRWYHFQAPRILGEGLPLIPDLRWESVAEAPHLRVIRRRILGEDMLTVLAPPENSAG
ncbi:MAG: bifunctional diaminohydroxyphosphoribosylaminopyrimidine deaminase/5-amino-6-(5-phosphoribosylamino)uracil reductase RibD [Myxococcales bacterium]|nr:bifunctional diaminohydroxyphosphoribosylaminopyrimidine deaminase/5-amino-6-(5-phosphoribosylamino)uracil reductase RibD [Myxococcales bacterium]